MYRPPIGARCDPDDVAMSAVGAVHSEAENGIVRPGAGTLARVTSEGLCPLDAGVAERASWTRRRHARADTGSTPAGSGDSDVSTALDKRALSGTNDRFTTFTQWRYPPVALDWMEAVG
jgi:hypothetical protein